MSFQPKLTNKELGYLRMLDGAISTVGLDFEHYIRQGDKLAFRSLRSELKVAKNYLNP